MTERRPHDDPNPRPLPRKLPVFVGPEAEARAQRLGLPGGTEVLRLALLDGASGARATTEWHPRTYRGDRMWGEAVASLRYRLRGLWRPETVMNVDLVVEPRRKVGIIVTAGTAATGVAKHRPDVRYPRKDVTSALISGTPDSLFGPGERPPLQVWFLLHYLDGPTLRGELSRPGGITSSGFVSSWAERIILTGDGFDDSGKPAARDDVPPDVDVTVQRRVS